MKSECLTLLRQLRNIRSEMASPIQNYFWPLVTPMSILHGERCFTLCHAIHLRLLRDFAAKPRAL